MRDSVVFYRSWKDAIDDLPEEKRGRMYEIIIAYALDGQEPITDDPYEKFAFHMAQKQIDKNNQRYENGKRGGRPKSKPNDNRIGSELEPKKNQTETKPKRNVNVNVNDNVNDNNNGRKFIKPTVDQVRSYCQERRNGIDGQQFVDFYEARGWKLTKGVSMKDWKASVRTWERNRGGRRTNRPPERDYDMDELERKLLASN